MINLHDQLFPCPRIWSWCVLKHVNARAHHLRLISSMSVPIRLRQEQLIEVIKEGVARL
jgi:hypothetical protein